jgi:hypothetical protein
MIHDEVFVSFIRSERMGVMMRLKTVIKTSCTRRNASFCFRLFVRNAAIQPRSLSTPSNTEAMQATDSPEAAQPEEPKPTREEGEMGGEWMELMGQDLQMKVRQREPARHVSQTATHSHINYRRFM